MDNKKNTLSYKIGQAFALMVCSCVTAIIIALTVKLIMWIL